MNARIGIVGIGWWATFNHIPTIAECTNADIVAICDLDPQRLQTVGDEFGIGGQYDDLGKMLAEAGLDGVMVATPHIAHTEPAIAALDAGCHVLVEKPMATNAADGWAIADAARRNGKSVIVPCGLSFTPFTEKAAALIRKGHIGDVRHAVCEMGSALHDLFAGEPMLETADHFFRPPASTWADPEKAGGYGWGQLSHALSWLFHVGDMRLQSVFCMDGKSPAGVDMYDAATARAVNGATVSISGAGTVPKHKGLNTNIRLYGTEGMLVFNSEKPCVELHRNDGSSDIFTLAPGEAEYDGTLPVKAFADLCAGAQITNPADAENGAKVTEALEAMYRSAKSGSLVTIGS